MIALLGGLGAALAWGTGTFCSARSSRSIGAWSVVGWVMLFGLLANLVVIAVGPSLSPGSLSATDIGWMLVSGLGNVVGLILEYTALRRGKVGVVTPVTSTEGAIAAVLAVVAGEALGIAPAGLLAVVVLGVVLAGVAPEEPAADQTSPDRPKADRPWPVEPALEADAGPAPAGRTWAGRAGGALVRHRDLRDGAHQ